MDWLLSQLLHSGPSERRVAEDDNLPMTRTRRRGGRATDPRKVHDAGAKPTADLRHVVHSAPPLRRDPARRRGIERNQIRCVLVCVTPARHRSDPADPPMHQPHTTLEMRRRTAQLIYAETSENSHREVATA